MGARERAEIAMGREERWAGCKRGPRLCVGREPLERGRVLLTNLRRARAVRTKAGEPGQRVNGPRLRRGRANIESRCCERDVLHE